MISNQHLKEQAQKARHAKVMQSLQRPQAMNSTLFNEPRRVSQTSDTLIMNTIHKVLGDYKDGAEEIGKRAGQIFDMDKSVRSSREVNNQPKNKIRPNGVNRTTNNNLPSGRGQDTRYSFADHPPTMHDESKMHQNSSTSLSSKESGHVRNSLDVSSHNRSSQSLRTTSSSRQPSDKYVVEKDSSSSLPHQQKNKYAPPYSNLNHKSHSSSSITSSHNLPSASGLGSSSGVGGTKSSRPVSDLHHSDKSVHSSGSEKNYNDKHQSNSSTSDKHHSSNVNKTYSDLKVYSDKHHGDSRGHPTSDGKAHSSSSERTMVHSSSKGQSLSPVSLPPPNLQPPCAAPQLSQSQRQGPPLLQPQQTQQQQLPPQLQHQQPPNIIPATTSSDNFDENHHCSPSISPSSVFNATNNIRMKPSQLTPQHTTKSSKLSPPHLPENLLNEEDNVYRIVREMTSQPEKLTAIKTPVKNYVSPRLKKKPEKDNIHSLSDKTSMPHLSLNQNPRYKNKARLEPPHLEIPKNFHGSNADNLSLGDSDLTHEIGKDELDKIIAEMTCIKSPISAISTPEKINAQPCFHKNINFVMADSDSEGSASDADERRPSDEKPSNSSSSDEDVNSIVKQLDISQQKDAITEEVKNHMPMMLSPMVDGPPVSIMVEPSRAQEDLSQEDLSQDLEISDSDNESIKSGPNPNSEPQPPTLICNASTKLRKGSSGFDIPQENDSDEEMEDVYKNPAADVHNSEVPTEITAPIDPTHFCGTAKLCTPTARKGSRESPHKNSDNEESDDDDDSDEEEEEEEEEKKSEDEGSAEPEELQEKVDQASSSSSSSTESTEYESDGSDVEVCLKPSPPSEVAKPVSEGELGDSTGSTQKSPTLSWGLSRFITKPLEKPPTVTDPQSKSESDNCSSVANSNPSSASNKDSSDDSSSESANSDSDDENPSHKSLPNASPNKSPLLSDSEELPEDSGSLKRSSISSSALDEVTPAAKNESFVGDMSTKIAPSMISTSLMTTTTTTSSTTKLQDWPGAKIKKGSLTPTSTPMSVSPISSSVDKRPKRKVSLPININLSLLSSSSAYKKILKLSPEPSQPAENSDAVKLESVPCSQSPPEAAVDKKICQKSLMKRENSKFTVGYNSRLKRPVMVRINVNLLGSLPLKELSLKAETPKSPADLVSSSTTNKPFVGSISGVNTVKSAPSTTEVTATTTATTPPSLPPPPTTARATTPSSSSTSSSSTSTVTATSKMALPHLAPPSTTSTTLEKDFNFRIPKRNAESDPQDHRAKMVKVDLQSSSKSEAKTDLVKMDSTSKKSDAPAASKSGTLPPPENLFASNKGNKLPKELKPQGAKYGHPSHDNNIAPTVSAPVDENCDSMPNPNSISLKKAKENLSVPSTSLSSKSSSDSLKDMTKAATASSSTSASSSSVVEPSSASKLSLSSSGASSAANIADPRLTPSTTTSSNLNTNSNSSSAGDCSSSSSNNSCSKRSSDNIRSGRPLIKVQATTSSSSSSSNKHKNSVNSYFQEATKLKHEGNKKTDVFEKAYLYMESVLHYVQCGVEMEKSRKHQDCQKMLSETLDLLGQIGHYHQYRQEQKLSVLRLLLMSGICKKLYDLKKKVADNLRQALGEHYKQYLSSTSASATTHSHTPSPVRPGLNISTPSSRSTPSPSGSIDSIRSQGSSTSDARLTPSATSTNTTTSSSTTNSTSCSSSSSSSTTNPSSSINPHSSSVTNASISSSSQTVVIPKRIHSITRNYMDIMDYLAKAHQYSDQAAIQRDNCKNFMELLNSRCKTISVQSSILEHIEYVKAGLQLLQNS